MAIRPSERTSPPVKSGSEATTESGRTTRRGLNLPQPVPDLDRVLAKISKHEPALALAA